MPYLNSPEDGASLFYTDYRTTGYLAFRPNDEAISKNKSTTLFFIHGWPMSGRMYDHLMVPLSQTYGIRCIASDRRGFGKSEWTGSKHIKITYETFARDTLAIVKSIPDLGSFVFVGSSMGCGEILLVYELMKQEGLENLVKGFIWMGPSLPYPMQTISNPLAPPQDLWNMIIDGFRQDRVGFVKVSIGGVFGTQHGVEMSETAQEFFISLVHQADALAIERCCQILSNFDFTERLKSFGTCKRTDLEILVLHGSKDQSKSLYGSLKIS